MKRVVGIFFLLCIWAITCNGAWLIHEVFEDSQCTTPIGTNAIFTDGGCTIEACQERANGQYFKNDCQDFSFDPNGLTLPASWISFKYYPYGVEDCTTQNPARVLIGKPNTCISLDSVAFFKLQSACSENTDQISFSIYGDAECTSVEDVLRVDAQDQCQLPGLDQTVPAIGKCGCVGVLDVCEVCNGNGQDCLDCDGVPFGTKTLDACGVCGGTATDPSECSAPAAGPQAAPTAPGAAPVTTNSPVKKTSGASSVVLGSGLVVLLSLAASL